MKKVVLVIAVMLLTAGLAFAQEYSVSKKAGPYHVALQMKGNPAVVGDNPATIRIKDGNGSQVAAKVELFYFMPSMPSMKYDAEATPGGDVYLATITPTMPGAWKVQVKVRGKDGKTHKAAFDFSAK